MKTWAGIWRRISRCLAATRQIQKTRTSRRAIRCMVISVYSFTSLSVFNLNITWLILIVAHISLVSYFEHRFGYVFDFLFKSFISAVNGRMYGNLRGLEMCAGDKVRWYTFGLGTEVDIHGVYFEGNTFKKQSTTRDTVSLFPHTTATAAMQPNTPGTHSQTHSAATQKPHPFLSHAITESIRS